MGVPYPRVSKCLTGSEGRNEGMKGEGEKERRMKGVKEGKSYKG